MSSADSNGAGDPQLLLLSPTKVWHKGAGHSGNPENDHVTKCPAFRCPDGFLRISYLRSESAVGGQGQGDGSAKAKDTSGMKQKGSLQCNSILDVFLIITLQCKLRVVI